MVTLRSFKSLVAIMWKDWKVEKLDVRAALIANGQPTGEHISTETNSCLEFFTCYRS